MVFKVRLYGSNDIFISSTISIIFCIISIIFPLGLSSGGSSDLFSLYGMFILYGDIPGDSDVTLKNNLNLLLLHAGNVYHNYERLFKYSPHMYSMAAETVIL